MVIFSNGVIADLYRPQSIWATDTNSNPTRPGSV